MTRLILKNSADAALVASGRLDSSAIRRFSVDAPYDPGVATLVVPREAAVALELRTIGCRQVRRSDGTVVELPLVTNLRVEAFGCDVTCDALVGPAGSGARIGRVPLALLGLLAA